ncbi:hypothetical protein N7494_000007 [Penicillium frequentans]|uniref:Major facilitator superfamily (MFS) profile domain-containing protein n=1 Tax=Penicillium frequentans TaxID=3151616 RepID=A0AAD6D7E0_9EURO|nr:hypothetical protein N7494_000007 [Penicillium glabrum]
MSEQDATEQYKGEFAMVEFAEHVEARDAEFKKRNERLVRKLDLYIAPVMMLLMLISYLDRGNIGFAATQGMTDDIGLTGTQLNTAISIFYIFYVLAEFPTSLLVKRLQFNRVIPTIAFAWGLVCMCNGFVKSFSGLCVCRLILGLLEGCLFPSMTLLLANWYLREELGTRISYLFIASALAGAFGGLIAFGILYMEGIAGYPGWRWLYILEGAITMVFAVCCVFLVPKNYETAYFLSPDEKQIMRYRDEQSRAYSGGQGHYKLADVKLASKDIKTWIHGVSQICVVTILYVNLWGAIVYGIGAILSDRHNVRYLIIASTIPFGIAGYAILLVFDVPVGVLYFAMFLVATPCFLATGSNIAWLSSNCAPDGKRAASLGILLTLTNLGGIIAGQIYQSTSEPRYVLGHSWSLGSLAIALIGCSIMRIIYHGREKSKEESRAKLGRGEEPGVPELWHPTDRGLDFKYLL